MEIKKNRYEYWRLAVRRHKEDIAGNTEPFTVIKNPFGYWAADPFIVEKDGLYYIFAELCDKRLGRGKLGVTVIDENLKTVKPWKVIMDNKHHLSFPNVYRIDDDFVMMPESNLVGRLSLFRATEFPRKWEENVLVSGERFCDSVFFDENTIISYDDFSDDKKLLILKNTDGQWKRAAEIRDTERHLRPAGKLVSRDGADCVVPMQDCGEYYGRAIRFTRLKLGENGIDGKPELLFELNPDNIDVKNYSSELCGMHTYNFDRDIEIIDLKSYEFSFMIWFRKKKALTRQNIMRCLSKIKRTLLGYGRRES